MRYLTCNNCFHANEVKSEYLTFCEHCGKKISNNYKDWSKENPGKSFEDFNSAVCHNSTPQDKTESVPPQKRVLNPMRIAFILLIAAFLGLGVFLGVNKGQGFAEEFQSWALRNMQFNSSDINSWITMTIPDGNFEIKFPEEPKKRVEGSETVMGNLDHIKYIFEPQIGKDDNLVYGASYVVYPPKIINSRVTSEAQIDEFINYTVERRVNSVAGKIIYQKDISYGLFPGKEVKVDYQNGLAEIKYRFYLVDNTLYILQVISSSQNSANKAQDVFLNSFKLLVYAQTINQ